MAFSVTEHMTLDLGVMSSGLTLGIEFNVKKKKNSVWAVDPIKWSSGGMLVSWFGGKGGARNGQITKKKFTAFGKKDSPLNGLQAEQSTN